MRGRALLVVTVLGIATVWIGTAGLAVPARVMSALMLVVLPVLLLGQARVSNAEAEALPVIPVYVSSILSIALIAAFAVWAAFASGFTRDELGLVSAAPPVALAWTGAATVASLAIMAFGRWAGWRETPLLARLIPRSTSERAVFIALSLVAGIGEELAFRGFLLAALVRATGSIVMGIALSSIAFGLLHSYQHGAGVARAALLGALLAVPVVATGSIIPSMAAHALIDLVAGLLLADWFLKKPTSPRDASPPED